MDEKSILVSQSGCEFANGVYYPDGFYKERPMWTKEDGSGIQIWWNHGQWRIGRTNSYLYCINSSEINPPSNIAWIIASKMVEITLCDSRCKNPGPILSFINGKKLEEPITDEKFLQSNVPKGILPYSPPFGLDQGIFGVPPEKFFAFIVGFCSFKGSTDWEQSQRKDISMAKCLLHRGIPEKNIVLLMDKNATTDNIKNLFIDFVHNMKKGDYLFFYYGSHGSINNRQSSTLYFSTYESHISFSFFWDLLIRSFLGSSVIISIDTCYSGCAKTIIEQIMGSIPFNLFFVSSTSQQTAYSGWRFARCYLNLFESSKKIDLDGDGIISIKDFVDHIKSQILFLASGYPEFLLKGFSPFQAITPVLPDVSEYIGQRVFIKNNHLSKGIILKQVQKKFEIEVSFPYEGIVMLSEGQFAFYEKNSNLKVGHNYSYQKSSKAPRELCKIIEIEDNMCRIRCNSVEIWVDEYTLY